jgi:hypothetical protein
MEQTGTVNNADAGKRPRRKRRWLTVLLVVVLLLVVIRLVLPYFVLKYVNKSLGESKTYPGSVVDVDLALIRGAYKIKGVKIEKNDTITGKRDSIPFFTSPMIDLSVEWGALFKGRLVGEIDVDEPRVYFVKGKHKDENLKADTTDFKEVIRDLMPLKINRFEIRNGEIHYIDPNIKPRLDVKMTNIQAVATNLGNTNDSAEVLPAGLKGSADVYNGSLELNMKLDPLNKQPTFDMNANVTAVDLTKLNDFFRAYGRFDVKKGSFGLYTEFAGSNGKFKGYVKPLIHDIEVGGLGEKDANFAQKLWESVVGVASEIFENQPKDQLATKIPIEGSFEKPDISLWNAVIYVLRNAFVHALRPSIDQTIDIGKVEEVKEDKNFIQKLFGGKEKNGEGDKKEKGSKRKSGKDER